MSCFLVFSMYFPSGFLVITPLAPRVLVVEMQFLCELPVAARIIPKTPD